MHFLIIFKGLRYCLDLSNSEFTLLWNDSSQSNIELSLSTSSLFYQNKTKKKEKCFYLFRVFFTFFDVYNLEKKKKYVTEILLWVLFLKKSPFFPRYCSFAFRTQLSAHKYLNRDFSKMFLKSGDIDHWAASISGKKVCMRAPKACTCTSEIFLSIIST